MSENVTDEVSILDLSSLSDTAPGKGASPKPLGYADAYRDGPPLNNTPGPSVFHARFSMDIRLTICEGLLLDQGSARKCLYRLADELVPYLVSSLETFNDPADALLPYGASDNDRH